MYNFYRLALTVSLLLISAVSAATPSLVVDGDGDGVSDERDECPYSPPGSVVAPNGCNPDSLDSDGDGVEDPQDDCPYSPPGAWVDSRGCALDSDFDGVADGIDLCPQTALNAKVDQQGCAAGQSRVTVKSPASKLNPSLKAKPAIKITQPEMTGEKAATPAASRGQNSISINTSPIDQSAPPLQAASAKPDQKKNNPEPVVESSVAAVATPKSRDRSRSDIRPENVTQFETKPTKQPESLSDLMEPPVVTTPSLTTPPVIQAKNKSTPPAVPEETKTGDASDWQKEPLFRTLFFARHSSEITSFSMEKISRALPMLIVRRKSYPALKIEIVGYAEAAESDQDALSLSQERANLVAAYLQAQGIPRSAIRVQAKGVDDARTVKDDTSLNRRVEILTYAE